MAIHLGRYGHTLLAASAGAAAIGGLFVVGMVSLPAPTAVSPTSAQVERALLSAGLSPESLAASGVAPGRVGEVVTDARDYLQTNLTALQAADTAVAEARAERDRLRALAQAGKATPQDLAALASARQQFSAAVTQRDGLLESLVEAASGGFSPQQNGTIDQARSNAAWDLPPQYLVASLTEPQWVGLRDALSNEQAALTRSEALDPGSAQLLAIRNADPAVAAAKANLDAHLAGVRSAWREALDW